MQGTAWWNASEINGALLKYLIHNYDPGTQSNLIDTPTKEEYVKRINQLCKTANISCNASEIKFTEPVTPPQK
jgi:hypothetical protein